MASVVEDARRHTAHDIVFSSDQLVFDLDHNAPRAIALREIQHLRHVLADLERTIFDEEVDRLGDAC